MGHSIINMGSWGLPLLRSHLLKVRVTLLGVHMRGYPLPQLQSHYLQMWALMKSLAPPQPGRKHTSLPAKMLEISKQCPVPQWGEIEISHFFPKSQRHTRGRNPAAPKQCTHLACRKPSFKSLLHLIHRGHLNLHRSHHPVFP